MKKSKINLVPNQEGTTIRPSSNPDVHFIRLNQTSMQLNPTTNFLKTSSLSMLVFGTLQELQDNLAYFTSLKGNLVIHESFVPSDNDDLDRDIKRAGSDDAPICMGTTPDGESLPIYRRIILDPTALLHHTLIPHTNVEEIREFSNTEVVQEESEES
jgi:hypothetical protein|tara:strand:+ start:461 stop:931 length:471 start_codon:yes stop_codon:yes gene_type:complete